MATDQGVGGSNPLTHVYCKKKAGQIVLLFFLQRTYGSDSNGFGLHSVPVGAERMSAGHPAPSHARYIVLLFSCNEPTVRIRTGSVYAPLRSALNEGPPDIQHPLTHVILYEKQDRLSCFFSCNEPTVRIRTGSIYAPLRSVLNGCPPDIQHPLTHV